VKINFTLTPFSNGGKKMIELDNIKYEIPEMREKLKEAGDSL